MFKLLECCGNRSRHKTLYRPSRRSLAKAAGRSTEREEIITLTFVRKRDERAGVAADTGLKLHLDAKGMYVESVRPGSVGAPDELEGCPQAIRLHSQLALRRLLSTPNHAAWGCPHLRNSLGQPASRFGCAARPDLLSPAGAEIGLLPGDGIVVVNGQECVDVRAQAHFLLEGRAALRTGLPLPLAMPQRRQAATASHKRPVSRTY